MRSALAWCAVAGLFAAADQPKNLLKPTNKVESWRWEEHEGAQGEIKADGDAIVLRTKNVDFTDWHLQAVQTDLDLKEGQQYQLKFKAKAEASCTIGVNAMIDQEDWHDIGLSEQIQLSKDYRDFEFKFRASSIVPKKNRITVQVGAEPCVVSIKEMTLMELP